MKKYLIGAIPGIALYTLFYYGNLTEANLVLRDLGRISFLYIVLSLSITPAMKLLGSQKLISYRRVFGVLSFLVALLHFGSYSYMEYTYTKKIFLMESLKDYDILTGIIGLIIIIALGITSNDYSVRLLKSYWKKLQTLAYPLFLIVVIHVAFASRFEGFYIVVITLLVMLRTFAYLKSDQNPNDSMKSGKPRYLCVPCGYIYDEEIGDPDSGIKAGTKWEDVPETWRCPVCGVSKNDFIKIGEDIESTPKTGVEFKVVGKKKLTKDVIELQLYSMTSFFVNPGQFAKFLWSDEAGYFSRSYSVVSYTDGILTFGIKIVKDGRGGNLLNKLKIGDKVSIEGIYGAFTLKDTQNEKVFIATGTGLSPIVNMIKHSKDSKKTLLFGVKNIDDVFYEEELRFIPKLDTYIYCSELTKDVLLYRQGRINLDSFKFKPDAEFYICGNPPMVKSFKETLENKGYKNIYFEQFA